jgi:hypothetical protein
MDVAPPIWLSGCPKEDLFIAKKAKNTFLAFFAIKRSDNHMGRAISTPFTSIYPKNLRTNP